MAKKKKRRSSQRPRPRPQSGTPAAAAADREAAEAEGGHAVSRRAERKEEARRERERRIKQARRRQRNRKLIRWGIVLGIAAGIFLIWYVSNRESRELQEAAVAASDRVNASEVEEQEAELPREHREPYAQGESTDDGIVPAFGGNHAGNVIEADPAVLSQPIPEAPAIHNLEHGYVIVYYAAEGENALGEEVISALGDVVSDQSEVIMAPYEGLAAPLYLVAWGARQSIDPPPDANPEDVVLVTEAFIDEWMNGPYAPEAQLS